MLILSIESSAKPASVAVFEVNENQSTGGKLLGQYFQNNGFSHSRTLLTMTESLLKNLELKPTDIDLIAVASGPGSFTGVRIGVSAAKGLAWGLDIPVCGVSTLEAMAYQTLENDTLICPVMDARREQVYNALFKWHDSTLKRLTEDRAISLEVLTKELESYDIPILTVGDGVDVFNAHLLRKLEIKASLGHAESSGHTANIGQTPPPEHTTPTEQIAQPNYKTVPELLRYQTAYGVALAALNNKPCPATELEPFYLRPSQAEREKANTISALN